MDEHRKKLKNAQMLKNTIIVNAYAGPGAGKTTSCLEVCSLLKKAGYVAEYVSEYAKDLVWDKNFELLDGSAEHQFLILKEQLHRMDRLYGQVDFIVTDAPILLNQVYNAELTRDYKNMLKSLNDQYESFNFFVKRDVSKFEEEGRIQNLQESQAKDKEISTMLKEADIYFGSYTHENIPKIVPNIITYYNNRGNTDMKRYRTKSRRDWGDKAKQMEQEMNDRVKEIATSYIKDPALMVEAFVFGSKFYHYSLKNTELIYSQFPGAEYVQSFPAWKDMGYSVKAGEKGIKIFVPVRTTLLSIDGDNVKLSEATPDQKAAYEKGLISSTTITRFRIGNVFDISQTTYPPEKYPELFCVGYPSELHDKIFQGIKDFAENEIYCPVKEKNLHNISLRGYYDRDLNEITLNESLQGTQHLSTLCHELGHAMMHNSMSDLPTYMKEFEADALDIMIESGFGLELTTARKEHFVTHYEKFKESIKEMQGANYTDEFMETQLNEALSSIYSTYADNVEKINQCVEKYVPKELLQERNLELQHKKLLTHEKDFSLDQSHEMQCLDELDLDR